MNRLLSMLAFVFIVAATSLYAGKGQLNIVGKTYPLSEMSEKEKDAISYLAMDMRGNALKAYFELLDKKDYLVNASGGVVFIDGVPKGATSQTSPLTAILDEGEHEVLIVYIFDKYFYLMGGRKVFVGADTISTVSINATDLILTEKGEEKLKELKAQKDKEKAKRDREETEKKNKPEDISKAYTAYMSKFYRDEAKGVVIDPTFKLMWEDGDKVYIDDYKGAKSYCEKLSYAGYSDWRLPTIKELQSIVDDSKHSPALNRAFKYYNADNTYYWSSTIFAKNSSTAWHVDFSGGYTVRDDLSLSNCVRCVRQTD